jgi:hypothetical protein
MRIFSERTLRDTLANAGFSSVKIYAETYKAAGIVPAESADRRPQRTFRVRRGRDARCDGGMAESEDGVPERKKTGRAVDVGARRAEARFALNRFSLNESGVGVTLIGIARCSLTPFVL